MIFCRDIQQIQIAQFASTELDSTTSYNSDKLKTIITRTGKTELVLAPGLLFACITRTSKPNNPTILACIESWTTAARTLWRMTSQQLDSLLRDLCGPGKRKYRPWSFTTKFMFSQAPCSASERVRQQTPIKWQWTMKTKNKKSKKAK